MGRDLDLGDEDLKKIAHLQAIVSLKDLLSCGFRVRALISKFGGWWRYILYKNIDWPVTGAEIDATGYETAIGCLNIEEQRNVLGRGYEGYRVGQYSGNSRIFFREIQ